MGPAGCKPGRAGGGSNVNGASSRERTFLPSFWGQSAVGWEKGTFTLGRYVHVPACPGRAPVRPGRGAPSRLLVVIAPSSRSVGLRVEIGSRRRSDARRASLRRRKWSSRAALRRSAAAGPMGIGMIPRFRSTVRAPQGVKSAWDDHFSHPGPVEGDSQTPARLRRPHSSRNRTGLDEEEPREPVEKSPTRPPPPEPARGLALPAGAPQVTVSAQDWKRAPDVGSASQARAARMREGVETDRGSGSDSGWNQPT